MTTTKKCIHPEHPPTNGNLEIKQNQVFKEYLFTQQQYEIITKQFGPLFVPIDSNICSSCRKRLKTKYDTDNNDNDATNDYIAPVESNKRQKLSKIKKLFSTKAKLKKYYQAYMKECRNIYINAIALLKK